MFAPALGDSLVAYCLDGTVGALIKCRHASVDVRAGCAMHRWHVATAFAAAAAAISVALLLRCVLQTTGAERRGLPFCIGLVTSNSI